MAAIVQLWRQCRPRHYVVYRLPAIAAILFYLIRMKVVQQLTCLTLGGPNGPAYWTDELLNTPLIDSGSP